MTVRTYRVIASRGHQYRQRVEHYWDPKAKRTKTRILENLGPVSPVYGRGLAPATLPLDPPSFGLLTTRMMMGSLTAAQVIETVQAMGEEIPPGNLSAVGIRYDLGEKTLELLLWLVPSSRSRNPVPSVRPPSRSKGDETPPSSPSKGKRT